MADAKWFGGRLKELRDAAGLTQQQLAEKAGFATPAGIRDIEQGRNGPTWETVLAFCDALGVTPLAFMEPPGPDPPKPRAGRPRKVPHNNPPSPKRPRGRPKKKGGSK